MAIDQVEGFIKQLAEEFGAKNDSDFNKAYVFRNNTGQDALKDNGAYFGFIHPEEQPSGVFHDFSLTIFPNTDNKPWLLTLGVGSSGFKNDFELSTYPGLRRLFSRLINEDGFCKSDLSDIETGLPKSITSHEKLQHIKNTIKNYTKFLPVCQILDDPMSDEGKSLIRAFVAAYAKLRDWPRNNAQREAITQALSSTEKTKGLNALKELDFLLNERKFVVLQGPPGTGKTRLAKELVKINSANSFFTQFHAETTYSDFIYGIQPDVESNALRYKSVYGVFSRAIEYARDNPTEKVLLIIDEINRANLANVLGPVFYLFEHKMEDSEVEIELHPQLKIKRLPSNLLVVATMNTADRSLAVVDFALRRRFAWYTLNPQKIKDKNFWSEDFEKIHNIFDWYATSNELTLQPGQGYFIASSEDEMLNRIRYEIYPLIKEYLMEGLLNNAKEEFNDYFLSRINQPLFQ